MQEANTPLVPAELLRRKSIAYELSNEIEGAGFNDDSFNCKSLCKVDLQPKDSQQEMCMLPL